jgi:hypothetical protein
MLVMMINNFFLCFCCVFHHLFAVFFVFLFFLCFVYFFFFPFRFYFALNSAISTMSAHSGGEGRQHRSNSVGSRLSFRGLHGLLRDGIHWQ